MKKYFPIIILTIYVSSLKADCLEYGTHFAWPLGKVITNNSLIIINSSDSNFISSLSDKKFIYLKSLNDRVKIPLTIIQICDGGLNLKQVILKPLMQLDDGKEYGLYFSHDPETKRRHEKKDKQLQKEFLVRTCIVKQLFDTGPPVWEKQPTILRKFYVEYGCGPDIKIIFFVSAFDQSPLLIRALVKNKNTGKETTCYLESKDGIIELGHHMCWGEFEFNKEGANDKEEYEVTFNLIDESGNVSTNSESIKFIQPNRSDT